MSLVNLTLPKYELTLPISKEKVSFRPFTVKEEKLLLIAQETGDEGSVIRALDQLIEACTSGKYTIDNLNKIDAEFLFVNIRNKSMGEGVDVNGICTECQAKTRMMLNLEHVKVSNANRKLEHIEVIDGLIVTMKYPSLKDSLSIDEKDGIKAIAMSLDTIIEGDNSKNASDYSMEERIDFVESLTSGQLLKFKKFFEEFPRLTYDVDFKCKCGHVNHVHIEGIENFFV